MLESPNQLEVHAKVVIYNSTEEETEKKSTTAKHDEILVSAFLC